MSEHKLNDKFNPKDFEEKIYKTWEEKEYFKPEDNTKKTPYCIVIPPPNITGKLHMGHALDETLQDILIRYKRMSGFNTLWLPGIDHAAIATEVKITQVLEKEGTSKKQLGREKFLDRAWKWKQEYQSEIINQLKKLGCSCDWSRERFTLDEGLSKAVTKVFVNLYNKDLIYKGKRMINWCPSCNTSISDAEVEYEQEDTFLWHIRYKVTASENQYITIATTRPETMLGDTAVAVHPEDERYNKFIGKTVILPIINKQIPIIGDEFVEKDFGTGAVKITPAHDINDYQAGLRHKLETIEVFDQNWKMNDLVPKYKGLNIYEARRKIVEELEQNGALVKTEKYNHNVGKCYRCKQTIEPKISEQWFVKMKPLTDPAIQVVKNGKIKFIPERFDKIYFNWMENIQDWCISRQLWWGHRIPAYYCKDCNEIIVSEHKPINCKCGGTNIKQDEDTLDTWFSSALWPFSTLGWPEKTKDLEYFYPTSTLVTGYDIIFFWVARMIFSGLEHMGEIPFRNVFIHGIVRDSQGRKMSKSLGNGIDPLEVINEFGTDALRFSLTLGISIGNDIRYMPEKLSQAGNFANKLWNASKFVIMNLEGVNEQFLRSDLNDKICHLKAEDKWILTKLNNLIKEVSINLENFDLGIAVQKIYDFIWNEFCDWYIEMVKTRLYYENDITKQIAQYVLNKVLCNSLKLLHPFMPFITEEIYTKLYNKDESIMISNWPKYNNNINFEQQTKDIEKIKEVITGIRNLRSNINVPPSKKSKLIFITDEYEKIIEQSTAIISKLGYANDIKIQKSKENVNSNCFSVILEGIEIYIPFEDLVDIKAEIERLESESKKLLSEVERSEKLLSNIGFTSKAPAKKIEEEQQKQQKYKEKLKTVQLRLKEISDIK